MNLDIALFRFINIHDPVPFLDDFMVFMSRSAYIFYLLFVIIAILKDGKKAVLPFFLLIIAWILADGVGNIMKDIVERPRPFYIIEDARLLVGKGTSFSFPSNHAANYSAVATVLGYFFRYLRLPSLIVVLVVCLSRVYVGVHYPSDVFGGAVIGVGIALLVIAIFKKIRVIFIKDRLSGIFYVLLFFLLIARLYYISYGPLELSGDEAHYWEWSRRPDLSYYSKGPLIAYLIGLTTMLGGNTELGVRFLAPFFLFFSSIIIYKLSHELYRDSRISVLSGLLIQFVPLFSTYGIVMTIDSPFIFLWSLSLYLFMKSLEAKSILPWIFLGISAGLGMLAKYSMAFFFISGAIYLLLDREKRIIFKSATPYITLLISILVFSPVLIWNFKNNFVTLRHTAGHIGVYEGWGLRPEYFFEFMGSQLGVLTPLFFVAMVIAVMRSFFKDESIDSKDKFLFSFSIPELIFFFIKSIQAKVQANWSLMAYHALFIFTSAWFIIKWNSLK
ncbi:MAG: glycosyltransferase family 39 protein, partial [Thermodesulfovibrionales bacterium]|nr:glycosyltransferase family 39 protein [Thermodesulfovibrionales bacterium]